MLTSSLDWEPGLKPCIPPILNLGFLIPPQDEAEDSPDRPNKRQYGEGTYPSPDASGAAATGDINSQDKVRSLALI